MRFHFVAGTLLALSGLLLYGLIFGFQRDLRAARTVIQKESVESAQDSHKMRRAPELRTYINKALVDRSNQNIPLNSSPPSPDSDIIEPPPLQETGAFESQIENESYWCRSVPLMLETDPVKCVYPDACYGCEGSIIPPEIENAIPLCGNGNKSQLYHVECCPSFSNGSVNCPGPEACFKAENSPQDHCACGDSPDCKLRQVDDIIDCVCGP